MAAGDPEPRSLPASFDGLRFFPGRTPDVADEAMGDAFARLADYREGGIFVGHWAGSSEWERHRVGDELVHPSPPTTRSTAPTRRPDGGGGAAPHPT